MQRKRARKLMGVIALLAILFGGLLLGNTQADSLFDCAYGGDAKSVIRTIQPGEEVAVLTTKTQLPSYAVSNMERIRRFDRLLIAIIFMPIPVFGMLSFSMRMEKERQSAVSCGVMLALYIHEKDGKKSKFSF